MALSKADIKWLRSLQRKKFRQKYNKFIVEGDKMVGELLRQTEVSVEALYALPGWLAEQRPERVLPEEHIHEITSGELKKISGLTTPNQVLAVAAIPDRSADRDGLKKDYAFYLDGIRDPGNMGTILRIADWFGVRRVFCSPDCVDVYNPKVIQASMGAFLRVRTADISFAELLPGLLEVPLLGAVLDGTDVFDAALPGNGLIIIGSEAGGISGEVISRLTHRLRIPAGAGGGAESLNAAVATGIITAVLRHRQRESSA